MGQRDWHIQWREGKVRSRDDYMMYWRELERKLFKYIDIRHSVKSVSYLFQMSNIQLDDRKRTRI